MECLFKRCTSFLCEVCFLFPSHWESESLGQHLDQWEPWKVGNSVLIASFPFSLICSCISVPLYFHSSTQNNLFLCISQELRHYTRKQGLDSKESIELFDTELEGFWESGDISIHLFCTVQLFVYFSFRPLSYYAKKENIT